MWEFYYQRPIWCRYGSQRERKSNSLRKKAHVNYEGTLIWASWEQTTLDQFNKEQRKQKLERIDK
jgi:hypothetical protein